MWAALPGPASPASSRVTKRRKEAAGHDTDHTGEAALRPHGGGSEDPGGKAFAHTRRAGQSGTHRQTVGGCQEAGGDRLQLCAGRGDRPGRAGGSPLEKCGCFHLCGEALSFSGIRPFCDGCFGGGRSKEERSFAAQKRRSHPSAGDRGERPGRPVLRAHAGPARLSSPGLRAGRPGGGADPKGAGVLGEQNAGSGLQSMF